MTGLALGGFGAGAGEEIKGIAFGSLYVRTKKLKGIAVGSYVKVNNVNGLSIGVVNVTKKLNGLQIGIINYAKNNPKYLRVLPFFNYHRN